MKGPAKSDMTKAADRAGRNLRAVLREIVTEYPDFDAAEVERVAGLIQGVESLAHRLHQEDINAWAELPEVPAAAEAAER